MEHHAGIYQKSKLSGTYVKLPNGDVVVYFSLELGGGVSAAISRETIDMLYELSHHHDDRATLSQVLARSQTLPMSWRLTTLATGEIDDDALPNL